MSELWYWRSNQRVRGPLVTEELESLVLQNRLAEQDAVRLDGSDEWIPAAEIRQLFRSGTDESPAATAAKLLQTAATRRLRGASTTSHAGAAAGVWSRGAAAAGELVSTVAELGLRGLEAVARWLGARGRALVTGAVALAVVIFLVVRLGSWGPSDSARLQRLQTVWKHLQTPPRADGPLPTIDSEIAEWLRTSQSELEAALRSRPVSGSTGAARQSALARREMLFAIREIQSGPDWDVATHSRIDEALERASDYLTGTAEVQPSPRPPSRGGEAREDAAGGRRMVTAILIMDAVIAVLILGWWIAMRRR